MMRDRNEPPVDDALLDEWLAERTRKVRVPTWMAVEKLPPVLWRHGRPASADKVASLMASSNAAHRATLHQLAPRMDDSSMADLALELFQQWLAADSPSKHQRYVLGALGEWGDERSVSILAAGIRKWPRERKHARAKMGLAALAQQGSAAALAHIDQIGGSARQASLRSFAQELIENAAHEQGLSADELADRIIPTAGLSPTGTIPFQVGDATWSAALQSNFSLLFLDEKGKSHRSLPARKQTLNTPTIDWKAAKKLIHDTAARQSARLETAMAEERSWPVETWRQIFLQHPILRLIAQRLIWSGVSESEGSEQFFRVAEDFTFADQNDDPATLNEGAGIRVAHPIFWPPEMRTAWQGILTDYAIEQPFDQVARRLFAPVAMERHSTVVERYEGIVVDSRGVSSALVRVGWESASFTAYGQQAHQKLFPRHDVLARLSVSPFGGSYTEPFQVALGGIEFHRAGGARSSSPIEMEDVPPVVFSEVLRAVDRLAASAKS